MRLFINLIAAIFMTGSLMAQGLDPKVSAGTLTLLDTFKSVHITPRRLYIWLPDGYSTAQKYSVLYMHDGQMLFDASVTWNGQEWGADEAAALVNREGMPFIIVGIDNGGALRHQEYFPAKAYPLIDEGVRTHMYGDNVDQLLADRYLRFLVEELKPYIDATYSVHTDQKHTLIAGSSMGGLISLYAISEYPEIFGAAACLSTHWPGTVNPAALERGDGDIIMTAFLTYMDKNLPAPGDHRLYFDYGNMTLDAYYPPLQARADALLTTNGFSEENWKTVFFKGADHSENAWKARLPDVMRFLLKTD